MKIHIIKQGDTFYNLAQKYHVTVNDLLNMNPGVDPNNLQIGAKIKIPSSSSSHHGGASHHFEIIHQHVVKSGDTMWKLSQEWGVSLVDLTAANAHIKNHHMLMVGEIVNIPKVGSSHAHGGTVSAHAASVPSLFNTQPEITIPTAGSIIEQLVPGFQIYTVVAGDSLYAIATSYGISVDELLALNPSVGDPTQLQIGTKLLVPKAATAPSDIPIVDVGYTKSYTVKPGDTLWKLAKAWNVSLDALIAANSQLSNPDQLTPGQMINVPHNVSISLGGGITAQSAANANMISPTGKKNTGFMPKSDTNVKGTAVAPIKVQLAPTAKTEVIPTKIAPQPTKVQPQATKVEPLATKVQPLATKVEPLATKVQPLATKVEPLATTVQPLATKVEPLATKVQPQATKVEPLATTVQPQATKVEPLATKVQPQATKIEAANKIMPQATGNPSAYSNNVAPLATGNPSAYMNNVAPLATGNPSAYSNNMAPYANNIAPQATKFEAANKMMPQATKFEAANKMMPQATKFEAANKIMPQAMGNASVYMNNVAPLATGNPSAYSNNVAPLATGNPSAYSNNVAPLATGNPSAYSNHVAPLATGNPSAYSNHVAPLATGNPSAYSNHVAPLATGNPSAYSNHVAPLATGNPSAYSNNAAAYSNKIAPMATKVQSANKIAPYSNAIAPLSTTKVQAVANKMAPVGANKIAPAAANKMAPYGNQSYAGYKPLPPEFEQQGYSANMNMNYANKANMNMNYANKANTTAYSSNHGYTPFNNSYYYPQGNQSNWGYVQPMNASGNMMPTGIGVLNASPIMAQSAMYPPNIPQQQPIYYQPYQADCGCGGMQANKYAPMNAAVNKFAPMNTSANHIAPMNVSANHFAPMNDAAVNKFAPMNQAAAKISPNTMKGKRSGKKVNIRAAKSSGKKSSKGKPWLNV